ncbi:MAG: glycosyltransferase family 2 protein [Burkholderiales bacterium]
MTTSSLALPGTPLHPTSRWHDQLFVGLIVALLWSAIFAAIGYGILAIQSEESTLLAWKDAMLRPTVAWAALGALLMTIRTFLWVRYRPHAPATMENAPRLTIVIPAYNEGALVEKTIDSCVAAAYPRDRLQIIAIDDGSRDDTWRYIAQAAGRHPELVTAIRLRENRGKRGALAEGFRRATGEVIVTIDSDSIIEPQTLLAITGPFENPRVGAVAGKVLVLNRLQGIVPRMLHVRFIIAFDFLRSVQSTYGMVACCPGALSAYRAEVVRKLMPAWLNQKFLGVTCTIGEDRALTNDVLAMGYDAVYQRSAIVHTEVPVTYGKLCRMMIRWDRSYIREEIRLFKHVWQRPLGARLLTLFEQTVNNLRFPIAYSAMGLMVLLVIDDPAALLRLLLTIGIGGTIYTLYYLRTERSRDFIYGVLYVYYSFFALTWIFPYALATLRNRRWMTR